MANVDCRYARALQSYTITYPSPDETLLGTPVALPTAEPTDPQISYTIGPQHLPTVSPAGLSYTLTAILYAAGKNTDAASQTVYYRILKNGISVATGSTSVAANTFYTWHHYNFLGVQVGDVLACTLWATSVNVNWDYKALAVWLTCAGPSSVVLQDVSVIGLSTAYPTLTYGRPSRVSSYGVYVCHLDRDFVSSIAADTSYALLMPVGTKRIYRVSMGDFSQSSLCATAATARPMYYSNRVPTAISFRPLTLRV